jgi:eukaryotic-like serine/threonine-protein kinase
MSPAEAQQNDLIGATLAGKYKLTGLLGEGAMGAVYSATTPEGRVVAVKTLLAAARQQLGEEAIKRFVREAQVSSSVRNPHVVEVIAAGHDEAADVAFMVMELLKGEDLEQVLARTGALPQQVAVRIAVQAARGLAAAHALSVVHRDVKPSNIFLHQEGERVVVKVCDFGIAKEQTQAEQQGLTVTGSVLGSPLYMSPEQLLNAKKADHRADIWGLAMSAFDAVAGEPALKDITTLPGLVMALARQDVRTLSEAAPWCDPALSSAIEGALRRDPAKRYATMDVFLDALLPFTGGAEDVAVAELVSLDPAEKTRAPTPAAGVRAAPATAEARPRVASSNETPERYVGQTLAKRYVLVKLLRQGQDGWVYEAKTANSGRPCHLRLVPKHLAGSSREADALVERARAARDVRHPNLVRVLDAGIDPISTMPYVVFEPCEGKPLSLVLAERGKLDKATAAGVTLHVARALAALHKISSHHGAVRASTVHITERPGPDGAPVMLAQLGGWGEAKMSYDPNPAGTPDEVTPQARSMAPEQARESGKEVSPRTDAWGLSLILFEALSGRHPLGAYHAMGDPMDTIVQEEEEPTERAAETQTAQALAQQQASGGLSGGVKIALAVLVLIVAVAAVLLAQM